MTDPKLALIIGVGSGLGGALSKRFAEGGHPVAMVARSARHTDTYAAEITAKGGRAKGYAADALDEEALGRVIDEAEAEFGPLGVAIFNIGGRELKGFLEYEVAEVENTWRSGFLAAFIMAQAAARRMLPRGEGSIFFTGAPSSRRGMANHLTYAVAKFGVRAMAETMAREFSSQSLHIAHFTVDGGVGNDRRLKADPELAAKDGFMSMEAMAEAYYQTHLQPRSCWAFDVEMRPWNRAF
ncbi:MAG: SDR family NAD(P)-dependent oxidoreductase [Rhodospirillaceae bacterium]|jgi:NAD(P)-dependent dehydrogenase (short-subunit alcohol dehydrogenase family)|nr:SDR family NAD(P)-dependent oxidoreductase [Rhodospirillaceae bacterium]MBT5457105.1 SDR family NAD(P)-dependent oxidoreductase [Rhodospirillaceae bacterium]